MRELIPHPFITVIVPVRDEGRAVEATVRGLFAQDYPPDRFEVIVADGGSADDTVPVVRRLQAEFPNLRLVYNPAGYSSGGRNLGVRHMRGDVAVVIDGHCRLPDRGHLRTLADAFAATGADCLGRPQPLDAPGGGPFGRAVAVARASRLGHNPASDVFSDRPGWVHPGSSAVAYRRTVFHRVGLFDQTFDACEDVEFNGRVHRAGLRCYFAPALRVDYRPRATFPALFRQLARYGRGRARLAHKHPRSLTLPAVVPPLALVWLAVGPAVWPAGWAASVAGYAGLLLAASAWLGRRQPWAVRARLPAVFVGVHFGFAWGFLAELFGRKPRDGRPGALQ